MLGGLRAEGGRIFGVEVMLGCCKPVLGGFKLALEGLKAEPGGLSPELGGPSFELVGGLSFGVEVFLGDVLERAEIGPVVFKLFAMFFLTKGVVFTDVLRESLDFTDGAAGFTGICVRFEGALPVRTLCFMLPSWPILEVA